MSLLMDALRKAEADKKQADKAPDGSADEQAPSADELLEFAQTRDLRIGDDSEPSINVTYGGGDDEPQVEPTPTQASLAADMALEPLAYPDLLADSSPADSTTQEREAAAATVTNAASTSTMPSLRGAEAQLEDYFDDSATNMRSSGLDGSNDRNATASEQLGSSGVNETVASAHTVFDAGSRGPSRRVIGWALAVTAVVSFVLLAAGFYYFQQAPKALAIPSPSVALEVEQARTKEIPVVDLGANSATQPELLARIEADIEPTAIPDADPSAADIDPGLPSANDALSNDPTNGDRDIAVAADQTETTTEQIRRAPSAPQIGLRPGRLRIGRSNTTAALEPKVNAAYAAYVAGDFDTAKQRYESILAERSEQRDALLGLAALKLRDSDRAGAHKLYRQVLKRDPNNPTALAATLSIEGGQGDEVTASRLKLMLDEGVDSGFIYFSLGNLYARNNRWSDAQQAYFEALKNYPNNPDYNYNLAVSLDRIGQRRAALKYYEAAINLTDAHQASFDPANAIARIHAINASSQ